MKGSLFQPKAQGAALLVTLAVVVLVSVIAVTFATIVKLETSTARSSFESERAMNLANMAVDDVVAKLRDNIPLDSHWAAGPGKLYAFRNNAWQSTELFSGKAAGATYGTVALNGSSLGSANFILSPNSEHPSPDPMKVAWINVLQDGTRSTDADYSSRLSATNPVVGRYAYWTDTETSKVNLNTAGLAKTTYTFGTNGLGDIQNLTGHPSRVDLSKLDDAAGAVLPAVSKATYDYTASGYWSGDEVTALSTNPNVRSAGEGMKRFKSIFDWTEISGVSAAQIEANKFNLTTLARAPELNPWGYNKWWMQSHGAQLLTTIASGKKRSGNVMNAPGLPGYPTEAAVSGNDFWRPGTDPDHRYYAYPFSLGKATAVPATATLSQNSQWLGASAPNNTADRRASFQNYMQSMMELLQKNNWPGMPAKSFVDKYGQAECEALAVNLLYLYSSAVMGGGQVPFDFQIDNNESKLVYDQGIFKFTRASDPGDGFGLSRQLSGIGPWQYINEVGVTFSEAAENAGWPPPSPTATPQPVPIFDPVVADKTKYRNVEILPRLEMFYPANSHSKDIITRGSSGSVVSAGIYDIEVVAKGKKDGVNVVYNKKWGEAEDTALKRFYAQPNPSTTGRLSPGSIYFFNLKKLPENSAIYVGPFDIGTTPEISISFRAYYATYDRTTRVRQMQVSPLETSPRFTFTCASMPLDGFGVATYAPPSYELRNPVAYRNINDWVQVDTAAFPLGSSFGAQNFVSTAGAADKSKRGAWPDISAAATQAYSHPLLNKDLRWVQSATNITGFPGVGWLSVLPTAIEAGRTGGTDFWRTLNFGPATSASELPDWLLIDAFALAYDSTYLSQTQGKININADIQPFGFSRLAPLVALLKPAAENPGTNAQVIAEDIASHSGINSGPCGNLPSDMYVYAGQICQVASLQGGASNQWQREALIRDIAGLVTTQCSDFKVYSVSQALNKAGKVVAEQRVTALVSRVVDVGPDEIPATADDMAGPDGIVGTADDLTFKNKAGGTVTKLNYSDTDPVLEGGSGRPPFKYKVSNYEFMTP